jgi:hypothetical protein
MLWAKTPLALSPVVISTALSATVTAPPVPPMPPWPPSETPIWVVFSIPPTPTPPVREKPPAPPPPPTLWAKIASELRPEVSTPLPLAVTVTPPPLPALPPLPPTAALAPRLDFSACTCWAVMLTEAARPPSPPPPPTDWAKMP